MTPAVQDYLTMLVIRHFEERVEDLFSAGRIKGTAHPAVGQEATAVGVSRGLRPNDYVTSTHRGHGHFIARGGDPNRVMAELFGKATGYSGGRGGSQLMADVSLGFLGANGITGGSIPIATGVALSASQRGTGKVAACFFGDGASNQGTFHESLNLAAIWDLPVLYICENNMYAMSMAVADAMAVDSIAGRASAYGIPGRIVDGNDPEAVAEAVGDAAARARDGNGPTLIECRTYRLSGHSRGDPCSYRPPGEEAEQRQRDPIPRYRAALLERGALTDDEADDLDATARETIDKAVAFAEESAYPAAETLGKGVFA